MATSDAPLTPKDVTLTVRDLALVGSFYRRILGLVDRPSSPGELCLGTAESTFMVLREDRSAASRPTNATGLYHTAFLLPTRSDLGAWLRHASSEGITLSGAADHEVSEALYLDDPEGNGIEIYVDRPRSAWNIVGDEIGLTNTRLDLAALAADGVRPWTGAPAGTVVGHVHFKVGDMAAAEAFWSERLGLTRTHRMDRASFLGSGGYHHHVGINTWHSAGFGTMPPGAGLAGVTMAADDETFASLAAGAGAGETPAGASFTLHDPAGIPIKVCRTP